jgi:ribosomal protein S6--L-glutamate ligase
MATHPRSSRIPGTTKRQRPHVRGRIRIGILMQAERITSRSHMPRVAALLAERGAQVDVLDPASGVTRLSAVRAEHDLYVLKDKSELGLSIAGALHTSGATLLNSYPVSLALRDKIVTSRALEAAGLPTPEAFVAATPEQFAPLLESGPLVLKPYRGSRGKGVHVVRTTAELSAEACAGSPAFAQRFLPHDGPDLKLYAIGPELFGVRRVWPATTYEQKLGEPFALSAGLVKLMERCRDALGMDLFGVDVIESEGRPFVVDASSFPGFKGVPDAAMRLARFIHGVAERAALGDPTVTMVNRVLGATRLALTLLALSGTTGSVAELVASSTLLG